MWCLKFFYSLPVVQSCLIYIKNIFRLVSSNDARQLPSYAPCHPFCFASQPGLKISLSPAVESSSPDGGVVDVNKDRLVECGVVALVDERLLEGGEASLELVEGSKTLG